MITPFYLKVKQVSSAIVYQENQLAHGILQSLGLDNLTIQAFGFSIMVLYFAYSIFSPKRKDPGTEREPSLKNVDPEPREAALDITPGEFNCLF